MTQNKANVYASTSQVDIAQTDTYRLIKAILTGSVAALLLFLVGLTAHGQSAPVIDGVWNKPATSYNHGDEFGITLHAKERAFAYLFYIDENDRTMALYPPRSLDDNSIAPENPLNVSQVENQPMQVDGRKGRIVIASISQNPVGKMIRGKLLTEKDWAETWPTEHSLNMTGNALLGRLKEIKKANPSQVYFSVEGAPMAKARQDSKQSISTRTTSTTE